MSKWLIADGDDNQRTIVDAPTENAAMQIARQAFGADATWKPLTDAEAEAFAKMLQFRDDGRAAMSRFVRQMEGLQKSVAARYGRKDVEKDVFGSLCAMAMRISREPTDAPFPAMLDVIVEQAKLGRRHWATCAATMQRYVWSNEDRWGAELVGFDQLLYVREEEEADHGQIEAILAEFYDVPAASRAAIWQMTMMLHEAVPSTLGVTWADYYASVLRAVFAQCMFKMDDGW